MLDLKIGPIMCLEQELKQWSKGLDKISVAKLQLENQGRTWNQLSKEELKTKKDKACTNIS